MPAPPLTITPRRSKGAVGFGLTTAALALVTATATPAWAGGGLLDGGGAATARTDPLLGQISTSVQSRLETEPTATTGAATPDPCSWVTGDLGDFLTNQNRTTTRTTADGQTQTLYARICGTGPVTWYWVGQTNANQLAAAALRTARNALPPPVGTFAPDITAGTSAIVHVPLRITVARWAPVTATATVPGLAATVTATPARLTFVPGDGSPSSTCPPAGSCSYTYRNASVVAPNGRTWPAQLQITWTVRWQATNGAAGVLPPMTTAAAYAIGVREIEAIEQPA